MLKQLESPEHNHPNDAQAPDAGIADGRDSAALSVEGMTCMGCVANVTRALKRVDGVADVDVNLPRGRARIGYDPAKVQPAEVAAALTAAGYP